MTVPNPPLIGYRNLLRDASLAASAGEPAHAIDWRLDRAWTPGSASASLTADLQAPVEADYIALCGHNLVGGQVTVRFLDGANTMQLAGSWVIPSNACVLRTFAPQVSSQWEIQYAGINPITLAVASLGAVLRLNSGFRQGFVPPPFTDQVEVISTTSQGGLPLGRTVRRRPGRLSINVTNLDEQWMRTEWLALRRHAESYPFVLSWNPAQFPDEAGLCWSQGSPDPNSYTQPGFMDGTMRCQVITEVAA